MSGEQVLISVRFHGYYLELLVDKDSTINELVQAMRDNSFIHVNIPNTRLIFKKSNNEKVQGHMKVTCIVQSNDNTIHNLVVQVQAQSNLGHDNDPDFFQSQTNKLLERIIRYLKDGTFDTLLKAKGNKKLETKMASNLTQIGQIFLRQKNLIQFYKAGFKVLSSNQDSSMNELFDKFTSLVTQEEFQLVLNANKLLKSLSQKFSAKQQSYKNLNAKLAKNAQELDKLRVQLKEQTKKIATTQTELQTNISLIEKYKAQVQALNQQIKKVKESAAKFKSDFQTSKRYGDQLADQIKDLKDQIFTKQKQFKKSSLAHQTKIKQFKLIIQEKEQIIQTKNQQIATIKQHSIDQQLTAYQSELDRTLQISDAKNSKHTKIQHIIGEKPFVDQLKLTIESEIKKPISQFFELLTYEIGEHRNYCLNHNFQSLIHQKRSLLFIGLSEGVDGKYFGAFTEEKYDMAPATYFIPDFNGCSFLFSEIGDTLKYFKLQDGENSIMYDLQNLVFGNDDLVIDFEKHSCRSKFVEGKSMSYNIEAQIKNKENNDYKLFLSDKLASQKPERGRSSANLLKYKIYEVRFEEKGSKKV